MLIRFYAFLKYKLKKVEINHKIQYTMVIDTLDNLEKYVSLNPLFTEVVKFINENDLTLYPGVKAQTLVTCKPGQFAIFFPQDGHQPCIGKGDIHKAIFKVKA